MTPDFLTKPRPVILAVLLLGFFGQTSFAQRTITGQNFVSISAGTFPRQDIKSDYSIEFGKFTPGGQILLRPSLSLADFSLDNLNELEELFFQESIIYGRRILSSVDRSFNLYLNACAGLSVECTDPQRNLPSYFELAKERFRLSCCLGLSLQQEFFITRNLSLNLESGLNYYPNSTFLRSSLSQRFSLRYILF